MAARDFEAALETIELGLALIPARAIYAAAKLGVADLIQSTPRNAAALSETLDVNAAALIRILRVPVSLDLFEQDGEARYSLSAFGQTLCGDAPNSVRDFIILNHELPYKAFDNIMHSIRTGRPPDVETLGRPCFNS